MREVGSLGACIQAPSSPILRRLGGHVPTSRNWRGRVNLEMLIEQRCTLSGCGRTGTAVATVGKHERVVCPLHAKGREVEAIEVVFWREATRNIRRIHRKADEGRRAIR
jgi:hypothetical protein